MLAILVLSTLYLVLSTDVASMHKPKLVSPNFIIQMPNFNSGAGIPTSSNYGVSSTIGQIAPGLYSQRATVLNPVFNIFIP